MEPALEAYLRQRLKAIETERGMILVLLDEADDRALAEALAELGLGLLDEAKEFGPTTPLTEGVAAAIKRLHEDHPDWHQHQIASFLNVNQGRVSEVLSGQKFLNTPPSKTYPEKVGK